MSESSAAPEVPTVPYFLILLVPDSNHASGPQHFAAHVEFIGQMTAANVVLLGGDFDVTVEGAEAAYLLRTPSRAEAEAWSSRDPLVANGVYRTRIVTWSLVGISPGAIDPALSGE